MFSDESGEESLCFKETEAMKSAKQKLLEWNRDSQIDQQIQWARCYEQATGREARTGEGYNGGKNTGAQQGTGTTRHRQVAFNDLVKIEGAGGQSRGNTGGRDGMMVINYNKIDKTKWMNEYGETRIGGTVHMLCWYHCNRPGGCVRKDECKHKHNTFPECYKGKPLGKCPVSMQKEVLQKCSA